VPRAIPTGAKAAAGKVLVRIVNFYTPTARPAGEPIDAYVRSDANPSPKDGVGTPDIAPTAYAAVSEYRPANPSTIGNFVLFTPGQAEQLADVNVDGVNPGRYTFILSALDSGQLSTTGFSERPSKTDLMDRHPGALPAAPTGKALLVAVGTPLMTVTPKTGYNLGQPGKGCFALQTPDAPNSGQTNIPSGGSLQYVADPGTLQVAYFDSQDSQCTGTPVIGPIPLTATAGDRSYVVAYGAAKTDLHLFALAIPVLPGDPPLLAAPPTISADAGALDVCSLVTPTEAGAALGAAVTGTKPDKSQGTCEYDAGDASLQIQAVRGGATSVFDTIKSGATSPQPISGLGDRGFSTTDPVNSIVIQKGDNLVGLGLNRSAIGGPHDDPSQDQPILRDLSTKALGRLG
jgi:hypothetical protein